MSKKTRKNFTMAALPFFFATGMVAVHAEENKEDVIDEVVVTGFRVSLNKAVDAKRKSGNITDNINAEDIGKSADQNIGEALSRVTGVSLSRQDGEGTSVSIRGAAPNLNNISLNGVALTSGGATGNISGGSGSKDFVDLSAFSSDILSRIEVYKTASADRDEGSLGGSVVLHTVKPLDVNGSRRALDVQGRYGDLSGKTNYKLSGGLTETFLDETLGINVTAFAETQNVRKDQVEFGGYKTLSLPSNQVSNTAGQVMGDGSHDVTGLMFDSFKAQAFDNDRERKGGTFGIQFRPTENTDIQFDATYTKQTIDTDDNFLSINTSTDNRAPDDATILGVYGNNPNIVHADPNNPGQFIITAPEKNDPLSQWNIYDESTGMFTKRIGRYNQGATGRDTSIVNTDNGVASLDLTHKEGNFTYHMLAGYSKTHTSDDKSNFVSGATWQTIDSSMIFGVPTDKIEPVGYDCSSGHCRVIVGTGMLNVGADGEAFDRADNYVTTRFNPDDIEANHLQFYVTRDQEVEDTSKTLFGDVAWEVDSFGITEVKGGFKVSSRDKDNRQGDLWFENNGQILAPDNTFELPGGISGIRARDIYDGQLNSKGFLTDLGFPSDNVTDGWATISADMAGEIIFAKTDLIPVTDPTNSRQITVDTQALFVKTNFAYFEDRLKGDVGLRYVKTENKSSGYSAINYINWGILDLALWQDLTNSNNPVCAATADYQPGDGVSAETFALRDTQARASACFDPVIAANPGMWEARPSDVSTTKNPSLPFKGEGSSDVYLPSLNLNYAFSDDVIGRFSVSKTMARPTMDALQPGFKLSESIWQNTGFGSQSNPDLKPLESKNLDLGAEYYFDDEGGMLSVAYFHKEYSNFEDTETVKGYMKDVRALPSLDGLTPNDLIFQTPDRANCFPFRAHFWNEDARANPTAWDAQCREFQVSKVVNGKEANINGLEIGYNQNFNFLPGIWSGLGASMNFTYQKTETARQKGTLADTYLPKLPLAYSPEQSYNATVFWEQEGTLIRLAYNHSSDVLLNRSAGDGMAFWQEGSGNFDISANYEINEWLSVSFNAINVTDTPTRQYATSVTNTTINSALDLPEGEGSALDGATKKRTIREFNTGAIYRLGLRASF